METRQLFHAHKVRLAREQVAQFDFGNENRPIQLVVFEYQWMKFAKVANDAIVELDGWLNTVVQPGNALGVLIEHDRSIERLKRRFDNAFQIIHIHLSCRCIPRFGRLAIAKYA